MAIPLSQLLDLVGTLDDSSGEDTARERFRRFLASSVTSVGEVRDYIEACLRQSGDQYNRALQDLVNHLGSLLGFQVTFGRYRGVPGEIGFDGLWQSPSGLYVVVEVKTSDVYTIRTATLVGYVDTLISQKQISDWDHALGLYVIGRPDPEVRQLENTIIAEKRTHQIRIVSANALLSLAELVAEYEVGHDAVLTVLRPSGPQVDPLVELMAGLVAREKTSEGLAVAHEVPVAAGHGQLPVEEGSGKPSFWLTPVASDEEQDHVDVVRRLLGAGIYAFGDKTRGRKAIKPGDWICFYASGLGIVAHARVKSRPENKPHRLVRHKEEYPWTFQIADAEIYTDKPVVIDEALRARLEAFRGRGPSKAWSWLVQGTGRISEHDFRILTRKGK
jgi:hypothetical protein